MHAIDGRTRQAALVEVEELQQQRTRARVATATFAGFDAEGRFQVEISGSPERLAALSTIEIESVDIGRQVVLAYADDSPSPIIIGLLHERRTSMIAGIKVDGEKLVVSGDREVELRCGAASIVLTRAGKVLIRGNYVLSRSRGANKIKGAFVDIN